MCSKLEALSEGQVQALFIPMLNLQVSKNDWVKFQTLQCEATCGGSSL